MDILKIIGKNIGTLIEEKGISIRQLAEILGVSHPTVSSYINGNSAIDSGKLYELSKYFNLSFDYFFGEGHQKIKLMYRADNPAENFLEGDREFINRKIREYISLIGMDQFVAYIPQQYNLKIQNNKIQNEEDCVIRKIAFEQRKMLGIEKIIPDNYYSIFAENNINVIAFASQNVSLFGCSFIDRNFGSIIFINDTEEISEERQLFSLCHEYAHLLFHREEYLSDNTQMRYQSKRGDINEKIVNKFAEYFLVPENILKECMESQAFKSNEKIDVKKLKNHFKVSYVTLITALKDYGYMNDIKFKEVWKTIKYKKYDLIEPYPIEPVKNDEKNIKLMSKIRNKYITGEISMSRIGEVLEKDVIEVRNLARKWNEENEQLEEILR